MSGRYSILRNWSIIFGSLFLLGSVGVYIGWDMIQANERIRTLIIQEAGQQLDDTINIEQANLGFGYVALENLEFSLNSGVDSISVSELQIGWSTFELFKSWFKPQKGITEVRIVNPEFFIGSLASDDSDVIKKSTLIARRDQIVNRLAETTRQVLNSFQNVSRISIDDAVIYYRDKQGNVRKLADEIYADFSINQRALAEAEITARVFGGREENLSATAHLDIQNFDFIADIKVSDLDLSVGKPDWLFPEIDFTRGNFSCQLQVIKDSGFDEQPVYDVSGIVDISDADYMLLHSETLIKNVHLSAHLDQSSVNIIYWDQDFSGGNVAISGKINNLFNPEIDVNILVYDANINDLQQSIFKEIKYNVAGLVSGNLDVKGSSLDDVTLSGYVQADSVVYGTWVFNDINSILNFKYPELNLESFDALFLGTEVTLKGYHNILEPEQTNISGQLRGDLLSWFRNIPLIDHNEYYGEAEFVIRGSSSEDMTGEGTVLLSSTNDRGTQSIIGSITVAEDIQIQGASVQQDFDFDGWLSLDLSEFQFNFSDALPVLKHELNLRNNYFNEFPVELNMSLNGYENNTEILATAVNDRSDTLFSYIGSYDQQENNTELLKSEFHISLPGDKSFLITAELSKNGQNYILNNINSEGLMYGSGEVIENGHLAIKGDLQIVSSVEYFENLLGFSMLEQGTIDGNLSIDGTVEHPKIDGYLNLSNGIKDSVRNINGRIDISADNWSEYNFESISLKQVDKPLLDGAARIDFTSNIQQINLQGFSVPSNLFNTLIPWENEHLQGDVSFDINYRNDGDQNIVSGIMEIPQGKFERFDFKNLYLNLASPQELPFEENKNIFDTIGLLPTGVWVQNFTVTTMNDVGIKGTGFVSFSDDHESDFMLSVNGNILSVFPAMDSYFLNFGGVGAADVNISGNLLNPRIAYGNLTIKEGRLKLNSVFENIENINLVAELQPGSRFIDLKSFEGLLNGNPAKITNDPAIILENGGEEIVLDPYELMEDGLNLGILTFETSDEGVDISIPDLMYNKYRSNIQLDGLNDQEKFYFSGGSGALENPYVRGKITLRDGRVTFPLIVTGEKPGVVRNFIGSIFWDVQLELESNNFYVLKEPVSVFRTVSDIGGDVTIELKIEDEKEGLYFHGVASKEIDIPFNVSGDMISFRGDVETLLIDFNVELFELYFVQDVPYIKGRAKTTIRDRNKNSITFDNFVDIYMILVSEELDSEGNKTGRLLDYGTWDENDEPLYWYQLSLDQNVSQSQGRFSVASPTANVTNTNAQINPLISTEKRILELMGITPDTIEETAARVMRERMSEVVLSPLLNPFNNTLRRWMNLDEFRVKTYLRRSYDDIGFGTSIPIQSTAALPFNQSPFSPKYLYLSPELRVGKYISPSLYVLYEWQYVRTIKKGDRDVVGLNHVVGIQYRMPNSFMFEFQYDYDLFRFQDQSDAKVWFRHKIQLPDNEKK